MHACSAKMPELLESLNIADDSNLAIMMSRTVGQCEAQEQGKEIRKCVTSLEGMKTFVGSNLPKDKRIAALERSSSIPGTPIATPSSPKKTKPASLSLELISHLILRSYPCYTRVIHI